MLALAAALMLSADDAGGVLRPHEKPGGGHSASQVRHLLGPPDGVVTEADPLLPIEDTDIVEMWGYGCERPGAFPQAGVVSFLSDGKAWVASYQGQPYPSFITPEDQIRRRCLRCGRNV